MKFVVLLQSLARDGCLATVNWNIIKRPHVKLVKTNFNHQMPQLGWLPLWQEPRDRENGLNLHLEEQFF